MREEASSRRPQEQSDGSILSQERPNSAASPSERERFYAKTRRSEDGCLEWTAGKVGPNGYGGFRLRGKVMGAHRAAWIIEHGEVLTSEQHVLHSCDNPLCVDITHLRVGTREDNAADRVSRNRVNTARGEAHHRARFSDADVARIRQMVADGVPRADIAADIGCSYGYVSDIVNGRCRTQPSRPSEVTSGMKAILESKARSEFHRARQAAIANVVHPDDEIPGEEWRQTNFEGYWVSSLGRVRGKRGTILRPWTTQFGHLAVQCGANGKRGVHTLVCEAWHGPKPDGMWVGHRDGNPQNNVPANLRWVTPSENSQDTALHGKTRTATGEHFNAKLTWPQVRAIRAAFPGPKGTVARLAMQYGVNHTAIIAIRDNKVWQPRPDPRQRR
ncbi:HNH endonuclease [Paenarthrobacter nicotinovorans]|uniref:HNH endonuclease n=1 Tax=Paenarthrobacter nicotinovorans TaxID=29320 RepID=UPI00382A39C0